MSLPPPEPRAARAALFWFPALLLLLTLAAYAPALRASFIWDDDAYLTGNPTLRQPDALRRIWLVPQESPQYYPMVFTLLYAEKSLWGLNPLGYHLVNVLLHAGSALLLWLTLRRLKIPGAMLAALLFAVHPVAVESVAWITELKNTLAGILALASLYVYLPFALDAAPRRPWPRYSAALALFLLAMLSKTVACGLAPVLLLILWWKRDRLTLRDLLPLLPFFLIGALLGYNTAHLEIDHVGATGSDFALNPGDRLLLAGRAAWFYFGKDLLPAHLAFFYERWGLDVRVWWQWLFPAAALLLLVALFLARKKIGRGPFAAAASFLALLFPALGFFNFFPMVFSYVADHFQYLALMVFVTAAATLAARFTCRWRIAPRALLASLLIALLAATTAANAGHYADPWTLWSSLAAENQHWMGLQGMSGLLLQQAADRRRAGASPDAIRPLIDRVFALNRAVEVQRPNRGEVHNNNAEAFLLLGDTPRALAEATTAVRLSPQLALVHQTLAKVYEAQNDPTAALAELRAAVAAEPTHWQPHAALGDLLLRTGDEPSAETELARAADLSPAPDAWETLGYIRALRNEFPAARDAYRHALALDPHFVPALDGLARTSATDPASTPADLAEALTAAAAAVNLSPQPLFLDTLGMVRWRLGDAPGAIAAAQAAREHAAPAELPLIERHLSLYFQPGSAPAHL